MLKTRTRKILGDILARKGRTLLVALSIMIGVFGVSTLVGMGDLLVDQLRADLKEDEIAMNHVYIVSPGEPISAEQNAEYLAALQELPGVTEVEGQAAYAADWYKAGDVDSEGEPDFQAGTILAFTPPFGEIKLEPIARVVTGRYPEAAREIAVEQRFADATGITVGDRLIFRNVGQSQNAGQEYEVVGVVFHPYFIVSGQTGQDIPGEEQIFASYETAQEIVGFTGLSSIYARYESVDAAHEAEHEFLQAVSTQTPYVPVFSYIDDPENNYILTVVSQVNVVLTMLALIAMVVSGFLVTNVISTIVVEQKRQIGVMKSLGATRWDSIFMYSGMALVYGAIGTLLGLMISIPVTGAMAKELAPFALTYIEDFRISTSGIVIGLIMGLLVPVLAALLPVFSGTRVSILDAMTDLGIASNWGQTRLSRVVGSLPLPITLRQALSNVIQKRGRLLLTGLTLTLAVAAFMGVTAVFAAIADDIESIFDTFNYEIAVATQKPQDFEQIRALALENLEGASDVYPGYGVAVGIEGYESTNPLTAGSNQLSATGLDPASPVIQFDLEEGEGWSQDPTREGVIVNRTLADKLGKGLGDKVVVSLRGESYEYEIIGIDKFPFDTIYFNWAELARIAGYIDEAGAPLHSTFYIEFADDLSIAAVNDRIKTLEEVMLDNGIQAVYFNRPEESDAQAQQMTVFSAIFNITSGVMAAVGAIGLLATLSMSVFERQKEIGVMRSIGAGSSTIITQFLTEGVLVGLVAWLIGVPLSYLLGQMLIGSLPFGGEFQFSFPPMVLVVGFVGIIAIAMIASIWPSLAAARKTVSDILRYQ